MRLEDAVAQVMEQYMPRVKVRPGNGLSRNMNASLRSYEEIPVIIVRTVQLLAGTEALFGFGGVVRIKPLDLYHSLMDLHDDWVQEVPELRSPSTISLAERLSSMSATDLSAAGHPEDSEVFAGSVAFVRKPLMRFHQFTAAWTIARRIGVIEGHGEVGLHRQLLAQLRRLADQADPAAS